MAKSPIEPAGSEQPRRQRTPRAKPLDGVNINAVMKERQQQDRVLHARLKQIDGEIEKLMNEHDTISTILGIKKDEQTDPPHVGEAEKQLFEYTCADCGGHAGPSTRGDCGNCGAGPFEQAK